MNPNKSEFINKLKCIGIILVLCGHTLGINKDFEIYIYSFHMPLFYFMSGFVLSDFRISMDWVESIKHYYEKLILPYLCISIITWLPWVLFTKRLGADAALDISIWRPIIGTIYGIGVDGWLQHNAMLWFLPCLFILHMIFRLILINFKSYLLPISMLGCPIIGYIIANNLKFRLPWGIEIALLAVPFYTAGYFLSKISWKTFSVLVKLIGVLILIGIQYYCNSLNGRVDLNFVSIGNPFVYYCCAFSGIAALAVGVTMLPVTRTVIKIADASFVAYGFHRIIFSIFSAIGLYIFHDYMTFKNSGLGSFVYTLCAIYVSVLITPIIRNFFPIMVGKR